MVESSIDIAKELEVVLRRYLKQVKSDQPIDPDTLLTKLGLDSMTSINLMLDLETSFNVMIPDEMLTAEVFATASSLRKALETLVAKAC